MIIYRFKIICTVRHALRTVNIKALLLHALRRTVVIKYMSLLAVAHRDLRVARQNISYLQYYVDGYAAHLSDCSRAWDTGIPLMVAEAFPRLEGGVRASLEEYRENMYYHKWIYC